MPIGKKDDFKLQATAILAVRHGREVADQLANLHDVPLGDLSLSALSALLRRLAVGDVADGRDLVTLEALQFGLAERLGREMLGDLPRDLSSTVD
ncbi:MAG: hypothetical protein RJS97_05240 [Parvibaculaceae bacterium]